MLVLTPQAICRELRSLQQIEIRHTYIGNWLKEVVINVATSQSLLKSIGRCLRRATRQFYSSCDQAAAGAHTSIQKNLHSVVGSYGGCIHVEGESSGVTVDRSNLSQYVYSADLAVFECSEYRL